MKFNAPLNDLLTGKASLQIVRALVRSEDREATGRELATLAGLSSSQAQTALLRLESYGLVRRRAAGRAFLWSVEKEHILYAALRELFVKEGGLLRELESDLFEGLRDLPVQSAVLFGSVVERRERPTSDIDLLVETLDEGAKERLTDDLFRLRDRISEKYGNPLAPIVHTRREIRRLAPSSLLRSVRAHGKVILDREIS